MQSSSLLMPAQQYPQRRPGSLQRKSCGLQDNTPASELHLQKVFLGKRTWQGVCNDDRVHCKGYLNQGYAHPAGHMSHGHAIWGGQQPLQSVATMERRCHCL